MQQFGSQDWRAGRIREWLLLVLRFAITCDPKDQGAAFAMAGIFLRPFHSGHRACRCQEPISRFKPTRFGEIASRAYCR